MNNIYFTLVIFLLIQISIQQHCSYDEIYIKVENSGDRCIKKDAEIQNCNIYNITNQNDENYYPNYSNDVLGCYSCISHHYPKWDECKPVTKQVFDCYSYTNDGECSQCKNLNLTDDHKCTEPLPHCNGYSTINKCSYCEEPYGLNIHSNCINKIDNCRLYGKSDDICLECWSDYGVNRQKNACFNTIPCCMFYEDVNTCRKCFDYCGLSIDGKKCYLYVKIFGCKIYESESLCAKCGKETTLSSDKKNCTYDNGNLIKLELSLIYLMLISYLIL